jgi:ubiquinone/menaquinone biosynthesis C-methylase UbiE
MAEEFDSYAIKYGALLSDPLRNGFADTEFFHARKRDLLLDFLSRMGKPPSNLAWLDVGCGQGELLQLGKMHFGRVAGCDPSAGMLKHCQSVEVKLQPSPSDVPYADNSFDLVTAVCVYHHVPHTERCRLTSQIQRVVKPNGFFVIIEHNPYNPVTQIIVRRCPVDSDAHLLSARLARHIQAAAGLYPCRTEYFLCLPKRLYPRFGAIERLTSSLPFGGQYASFALKR